jgi:hypothetical protein
MADTLTKSQTEFDDTLLEVADHQRTFEQNYGDALAQIRRTIVREVAVVTTVGLALGGLVGVLAGMRRL